MQDKSSKKDGTGSLNYSDFSKWLGNQIHVAEGFYFRHDSKKNPIYDKFLKKENTELKRNAAEHLMHEGDVIQRLIDKIRFQWKTVRKAFKDFNEDNDEYIQKNELKFFLDHWGFEISKDQVDEVFNYFDTDKDNLISY